MRHPLAILVLLTLTFCSTNVSGSSANQSIYEKEPTGWENLLEGEIAQKWSRHPFPPTKPLVEKSPWSLDPTTGILSCAAKGIHEMYVQDTERSDGVLHIEWRYTDASIEKPNSGVFVRTSKDGKIWHQAQLATASLGLIFGTTGTAERPVKFKVGEKRPDLLRPNGEWNVMEITSEGTNVFLWINGQTVAEWKECATPRGFVGLEAEFSPIEFRNILFRPTGSSVTPQP